MSQDDAGFVVIVTCALLPISLIVFAFFRAMVHKHERLPAGFNPNAPPPGSFVPVITPARPAIDPGNGQELWYYGRNEKPRGARPPAPPAPPRTISYDRLLELAGRHKPPQSRHDEPIKLHPETCLKCFHTSRRPANYCPKCGTARER